MRRAGAAEHDLALAHAGLPALAVGADVLDDDVALELAEDLVAGIDVKVVARIRPPDDLVDELALREDFLVRHGRREEPLVLLDPAHQMDGRHLRHGDPSWASIGRP